MYAIFPFILLHFSENMQLHKKNDNSTDQRAIYISLQVVAATLALPV